MDELTFKGERDYQAALLIAKQMLDKGIITAPDFDKITAHFKEKYGPFFDTELSVKTLPL